MAKNAQILKLNELGQSVWYDNLSRDVLNSGELKSLIETGVSGLTSNPTIFKNAISDSNLYDDEMKKWAKEGLDTEGICEELMIEDVRRASDLLRPVYDATNGGDGYASIEVSPYLARETPKSIEAAKRIWGKLKRPNIMIKIPGTKESLPAVKSVLEAGINVNVTLLFSLQDYVNVAEAYISALEARAAKNEQLGSIASVASFFVSRVDAIIEKNFDALVKEGKAKEADKAKFFGKVGIANSKVAYEAYEKHFHSDRYKKLQGARVQRPLWASTGTKNPAFSPVMYIEELAGRDTVNTMPPATLKALLNGANIEPKLHQKLDDAKSIIKVVGDLGVNFPQLMMKLQDEGVVLFSDSYRDLLASIDKKRKALGI